MRHRAIVPVILLAAALLSGSLPAADSSGAEDKAFQEIKLLVFDEKWAEALSRLDAFLTRNPADSQFVPALYYRAKCLEEIGGRDEDALRAYRAYIGRGDRNKSLSADAEASIIDLAVNLCERGDRSYLPEVEERLTHPDKDVRYYAAIRLSYVKEKKAAAKSVPVLKKMLTEETNPELRDRAKIALLRVEPGALAETPDKTVVRHVRMFHIQIVDVLTKKAELSLNLPFALADLALSGMSVEDRALLKGRGYDIDTILNELKSGGNILEINDDKEGKSIKIWID
ncbi:MAG: HEAT repeat domain-containing protein [Candidatus Aminicenantes bacterium]|nr:HEAT repeat domain-containing protein [Candidatus Aminicenantes bacterium]